MASSDYTVLTLLITIGDGTVLIVRSPLDAKSIDKTSNFWLPTTVIAAPTSKETILHRAAGLATAWTGFSDDKFELSREPLICECLPYPLAQLDAKTNDQKLFSTVFLRVNIPIVADLVGTMQPAAELRSALAEDEEVQFELYRLTRDKARSSRAQNFGAMVAVRKLFGLDDC
ncbi:hypothetical protein BST61_g3722 [Cercospora zeina]